MTATERHSHHASKRRTPTGESSADLPQLFMLAPSPRWNRWHWTSRAVCSGDWWTTLLIPCPLLDVVRLHGDSDALRCRNAGARAPGREQDRPVIRVRRRLDAYSYLTRQVRFQVRDAVADCPAFGTARMVTVTRTPLTPYVRTTTLPFARTECAQYRTSPRVGF